MGLNYKVTILHTLFYVSVSFGEVNDDDDVERMIAMLEAQNHDLKQGSV